MADQSEKRVYTTLDGMRGVAAIAVLTLHSWHFFGVSPFPSAYLAVDLFFLISGVVLAHAYERRFVAGMTVGQFFRIRCIRLMPLFLLGSAIAACVVVIAKLTGKTDLSNFAIVAALLTNSFGLPSPTWSERPLLFILNLPAWSLFFEFIVNMVYVAAYRFLKLRILGLIVCTAAVGYVAAAAHRGDGDLGSVWATVPGGMMRILFSFFMGVLLYRLLGRVRPKLSPMPWILLVGLSFLLAIDLSGQSRLLFDLGCVLLCFPVMVAIGMRYDQGAKAGSVFGFLGTTSYAVYVLHYPVVEALRGSINKVLRVEMATLTPWLGFGFVGTILAFAWLVDRYYDAPIRRYLARRFDLSQGHIAPRLHKPELSPVAINE